MKKLKNILLTIIFSVMFCITGVFLTSCGEREINIAISASQETLDINAGGNARVTFTVTNYVNDGSVSIIAYDNAVSSNQSEHISFEVLSCDKGVTTVYVEGISGGSAVLVATTKETDNKVASIRINVKEYSDTLSVKNSQMYVSPNKDFKPSASDYNFASNVTERELKYYYITNPDKISNTELSFISEENKFAQEDVSEKLNAVEFDTCKLDKTNGKIQLYLGEEKVLETSATDAQTHKFVAMYENLSLSETYTLNVMSTFYSFFGVKEFGVDKEEISLIAYSISDDATSTLTVEVPYLEGGEISFDYEISDRDRTVISSNVEKDIIGLKTVYTFTIANKIAYKTTANIKLKLFYNNFGNILDDASVSFIKDIKINILVKPKEIRVNNLLESSAENSYVFYNNYKGDYGWQEFNIAVYATDSSYNGVKIEYDSDVVVKQNDITISSGTLITDLDKPLLIRGANSDTTSSDKAITLTLESPVFSSSDSLKYLINYEVKIGATNLTINPDHEYSLDKPNQGVYVASNAESTTYTGVEADRYFTSATATSLTDEGVIKVTYDGKEGKTLKLKLEPIKAGMETFVIRLDNGISKEVVFRVVDTFDTIECLQKLDGYNSGVYSFTTGTSGTDLILDLIVKNISEEEMGGATIQVSSNNGTSVIKSIIVDTSGASEVIDIKEINRQEGIYTLKAKSYGNRSATFTITGQNVDSNFKSNDITKVLKVNFIAYNPVSKIEVKADGSLVSNVDLYGVSSTESLKTKSFDVVVKGLKDKSGATVGTEETSDKLVPYNFYDYASGAYVESKFDKRFVYWTSGSNSYTFVNASNGISESKMVYGNTYYIYKTSDGEYINVAMFDTKNMKITALTDTASNFVVYANVQQYGLTRAYALSINIKIYERAESINLNITETELSFKSTDTEPIQFTATISPSTAINLNIACVVNDESRIISSIEVNEIKAGSGRFIVKINKNPEISDSIIKDAKVWICAKEWVENGVIVSNFADCKELTIKYEDGSQANPFGLKTAADIIAIGTSAASMKAYYTLKTDIDISGYSNMLPLSNLEFTGGITGYNGATIKGIKISNSKTIEGEICYGLFAKIGASAVIENITFEGSINITSATADSNIGLIAGINAGTLKNVAVQLNASSVSTSGLVNIGGLVGTNSGKIIKEDLSSYAIGNMYYNCSPMITVYMNNVLTITGSANVGGIAGINSGEIINTGVRTTNGYSGYMAYVNIRLDGAGYAGSIAGINENIIKGLETSNIYVGGIISSEKSGAYIGGIVAYQKGKELEYITMRTLLRGYKVGAIYAFIDSTASYSASCISIEATDDGERVGFESAMIINYSAIDDNTNEQIAENGAENGYNKIDYSDAQITFKSYLDRTLLEEVKDDPTITEYYGDYISLNGTAIKTHQEFNSASSNEALITINEESGFKAFATTAESGELVIPMYYFGAAGYLNTNRELTTIDLQSKAQDVLDKYLNIVKVDSVLRPFTLNAGEYRITSDREFLTVNSNNEFIVSGTGLVKLTISSILNASKSKTVYVYVMNYFDLASKLSYYKVGNIRLDIEADVKVYNEISIETVANYIKQIEIADEKFVKIDEDGYLTSSIIGNAIKLQENTDVDSEIRVVGGEITIGSTKSTWKITKDAGDEKLTIKYGNDQFTSTKLTKDGDIYKGYIKVADKNYKFNYDGTQIFMWSADIVGDKITVYQPDSEENKEKTYNWKVVNNVLYISEDEIYTGDSNKITVDEEYDYEYVDDELHVSKGISVDGSTLTIDGTEYKWKVVNGTLYVADNIYAGDEGSISTTGSNTYSYETDGTSLTMNSKNISTTATTLTIDGTTYNWEVINGTLYVAESFHEATTTTVTLSNGTYNYVLKNNEMRIWLPSCIGQITEEKVELNGTTYKYYINDGKLCLLNTSPISFTTSYTYNDGNIEVTGCEDSIPNNTIHDFDGTNYLFSYEASTLNVYEVLYTDSAGSGAISLPGWSCSYEYVDSTLSMWTATKSTSEGYNFSELSNGKLIYNVKGAASAGAQISINGTNYYFSYTDSTLKLWQYQATGSSGTINLDANYSYVIDGSDLYLMKAVKGSANTTSDSQISINGTNYYFSYTDPTLKLWQYQNEDNKIEINDIEYYFVKNDSKLVLSKQALVASVVDQISINGVNYKFTYENPVLSFKNDTNKAAGLYEYSNRIESVYYFVLDDASGSIVVSKKAGKIIPKGSYDTIELVSELNITINNEKYICILGKTTNIDLNYYEGVTKIISNYDNYAINTSIAQSDIVTIYTDDTEEDELFISIVGKDVDYTNGRLFNISDVLSSTEISKKNVYSVSIRVDKTSNEYKNRHTKNIYGTYLVRYYTKSNTNIYKEIELILDDQYLDKIVYENYNVTWDNNIVDSMTSTTRVVPANYGLLSVAISPADCDFYRFNVTNNAMNYITGSTATGFEIGYLYATMKFVAISGIGFTNNGAYISKESLTKIPNYDGQFYIKYMFTNDSSVVDGSRVALDFKLTDKQGNIISGSENTETYTVYKKYYFELSMPNKSINADTKSYLLARGLTYSLDIENHGYDEDSISIVTDIPSLATIQKDSTGGYVVNVSEKAISYSGNNSIFNIIASATRKNNLGKTETTTFSLKCTMMEYVVNYNGEQDIVSGYNNGNISVAMGDRISLKIDMTDYIEYNSSDTLICEKVQKFCDELTNKGKWTANFITGNGEEAQEFKIDNDIDTEYFHMYNDLILTPNVAHDPANREYYFDFTGKYKINLDTAFNGEYSFNENGANVSTTFNIKSYIRGSEDTPVPIQDYKQFKKMNQGGNYILLNDIVITPSEFEPFDANFASLDGNNYKIIFRDEVGEENETVTFDVSNYGAVGLFSNISSDTIVKNLTIKMGSNKEQIIFTTNTDASIQFGILTATNNGIVINTFVEGEEVYLQFSKNNPVEGSYFAGLVAQNTGYITNSRVKVSLKGAVSMAGLVGNNSGTIASSYFKDANITNTSDQNTIFSTAGLCVENSESGKILTSYVSGKVDITKIYCNKDDASAYKITSKVQVAAFVYANSGTVNDCYSNALLSTVAGSSGFTFYNGGEISNCFSTSVILDDYKQSNYYFAASDKYETKTGTFENCYYLSDKADGVKINVSLASKIIPGVNSLDVAGFSNMNNFSSYAYGSAPSEYNNVWVYANTGNFTEDVFLEYSIDNKDGKTAAVDITASQQSFSMGRLELVSANIIALSYRVRDEKSKNSDNSEDTTDYAYSYAFDKNNEAKYSIAYGSIHNPYLIDSVDTFEGLFENIGDGKKSMRFVSDLDYSAYDETLTAYNKTMKGIVEGNGMLIRNIEINANDTMESAGLIGKLDGEGLKAGVFNITLIPKLVNFPNAQMVGTLVGKVNSANIENVEVLSSVGGDNVQQEESVTISGKNIVGGVIGLATKKCTIKNITSSVGSKATFIPSIYAERTKLIYSDKNSINDYSYAGGVVGYAYAGNNNLVINDIKYYGTDPYIIGGRAGYVFGGISSGVKSSLINVDMSSDMLMKAYSYAGIIAGESAGTITDVTINGTGDYLRLFSVDTYVPEAVGGVVGYMLQGKLSNIYMGQSLEVKETIKTINYVGGIVGYVNNNGTGNMVQIEKIIVDGDIHTHSTLGGIVGLSESIMKLDNVAIYKRTFTVDGNLETTYVGGFVGTNNANVTIKNAYSWANIVVESYVYSTGITAKVSSILANPSPYSSATLENIYTTTMFTITLENKSATVVDADNTSGEVKYVTESDSSSEFYASISGNTRYPGLSYTLNRLAEDQYKNVYTKLGTNTSSYNTVLGLTTIFNARTNAATGEETSSLPVALTQNDYGDGIVNGVYNKDVPAAETKTTPTDEMFYGCMREKVTVADANYDWTIGVTGSTNSPTNYKNIDGWTNPLNQNDKPNGLPYLNFEAGIRP